MTGVPKIPDSTKNSLHWRLATRARERWPELAEVRMRYRAGFAYVDGVLPDGEVLQLCRLRYVGSATRWGFAIYRASHDDYEDNLLPSGSPTGTAEEALDCACGLYLNDPTAWTSGPQGSCKVVRQAVDLLGCRRREAAIRWRLQAVASRDRPPSRSDLEASQVLTEQVKGTGAAQEARPRPLAAITAGQAAQS
jgi:hypothetical protein